jgi:hypothetical protein
MVALTGGDKDTKAPQLLKAKPNNFQTNFSSNNIELVFDEYLQLKNAEEQLIISPNNGLKIKAKIKGKKINLSLSGDLKANTTYNINFGEALSDYTESNLLRDFQYVFSTGANLDSISIRGQVKDGFKGDFLKDAIVGLYTMPVNDSCVYLNKPDYYARTNAQGYYQIKNIKEGKYKIFALAETNNNKMYDNEEELIGFNDVILDLKKDTALSVINAFRALPSKIKLKENSLKGNKIGLLFNQKVKDIHYQIIPKTNIQLVDKINTDSLEIYLKEKKDSIGIILTAEGYRDTVLLRNEKEKKKSTLRLDINNYQNPSNTIYINSLTPLTIVNKDSIYLKTDSLKYIKVNTKLSDNSKVILINYAFEKNKKQELIIADSALLNSNMEHNKTLKYQVKNYNEESFGNLIIHTTPCAHQIIYELLSADKVVYSLISKEENINIKLLNPGEYRLRIISDENNNNSWDTGNYLLKQQAEKVNYYPANIKVRANWDLEINLKTK